MENYITQNNMKFRIPLELIWEPKEDITAYELAMCIPYLFSANIMIDQIDQSLPYLRHFKIIDHNSQ